MAKHRHRASDAQRTAVQQALDEAFAAGRLDHFEHFERIRTATKAKYIDELRPLVVDLRGGDDDLGLGRDDDDDKASAGSARAGWDARRNRSHANRGWAIGIGIAVAVLAIAGGVIAASVSDSPSNSMTTEQASDPGPLLTAEGMERVIDSAKTEFAGLDLDTFSIHGTSAGAMYEDPAEPGKRLSFIFRGGEWTQSGFHSRTESTTFRIADIDSAVLEQTVESAPGELDMSGAKLSHISVFADPLGEPEYAVSLNDGKDLGTATFGPDGQLRKADKPD
ncbi:DUF1707 domain-containing protein [Dietzia sp. B19]|uniref:DUF1707 SHOCT-like domain-containing protein n=1 Tax=Dietzia sp. B19 TaxID=1630632 RepID=UPI0015F904C8|nr:DUF1707 domain-containing protein [Dietzia sp. B19]MBB1057147.1 DUF1707 domain-containing protein [Dietzia sp. B19]